MQQSATKAMVDSGNLTTKGIVMSERFFQRSGLQYESRLEGRVKTAAKNQGMEQKGITKHFAMSIEGVSGLFRTQALVLRGLSDEINIGCAFLQRLSAQGLPVSMKFHPRGTQLA